MNSRFEWSDVWIGLFVIVVIGGILLGMYAGFQDHSIRFYFLSANGAGQGHNGYCIDGYRNWYVNEWGVFCSDDIQKTISVLKELNDGLIKNKP